jgi:hypothetical protein
MYFSTKKKKATVESAANVGVVEVGKEEAD